VVSVGRLIRQKGFDELLDAWAALLDGWSDPRLPQLRLIGDGPRRGHLARRISLLDLAATVTLVGSLPRLQVLRELQQADVFALLVRTRLAGLNPEGLGLAAIEAAACGLPVVVGDSGGAPETVQHGRTGYVVDPADPVRVATLLRDLLSDPDRARSMGADGRRYITATFGAQRAGATLRTALRLPS
jgi:phosphatidylinositol alpha-1,6-mannosyltransferase